MPARALLLRRAMTIDQEDRILDELQHAVRHLADEVEGDPVAGALRRFAEVLIRQPSSTARAPSLVASPRGARAVPPLLYGALAGGALDGREFDRGMLLARRASLRWSAQRRARALSLPRSERASLGRYSPPVDMAVSPSSSLSSGTTAGVSSGEVGVPRGGSPACR